MSYYIHAAKFFLKHVTEIGGYLEVTDDGQFGQYLPESAKPEGEIVEQPGKLIAPGWLTPTFMAFWDTMSWITIGTASIP